MEYYLPEKKGDCNYYGSFNIPALTATLEWGDIAGQTYRSSVNISASVGWFSEALYLNLDVRRTPLYTRFASHLY